MFPTDPTNIVGINIPLDMRTCSIFTDIACTLRKISLKTHCSARDLCNDHYLGNLNMFNIPNANFPFQESPAYRVVSLSCHCQKLNLELMFCILSVPYNYRLSILVYYRDRLGMSCVTPYLFSIESCGDWV